MLDCLATVSIQNASLQRALLLHLTIVSQKLDVSSLTDFSFRMNNTLNNLQATLSRSEQLRTGGVPMGLNMLNIDVAFKCKTESWLIREFWQSEKAQQNSGLCLKCPSAFMISKEHLSVMNYKQWSRLFSTQSVYHLYSCFKTAEIDSKKTDLSVLHIL